MLVTADPDGLLSIAGIDAVMKEHEYSGNFHMVKPRLLHMSLATGTGPVCTAAELAALRAYANEHDLLLFIDGARLDNATADAFAQAFDADIIARPDADSTIVRMTRSWATAEDDIAAVDEQLSRMEASAGRTA